LRALARPRTADDDLADEIRFHIELETEKNIGLGMAPDEAKRIATVHFGGVQRAREDHRDVRRVGWVSDLAMDVRFTARSFRHSPAFFAAAVITIALAIGANVAIFSAVNAVVLRPLPFREPDRLVMLTEDNAERRWEQALVAAPNAYDWRASVPAFSDIMMYDYSPSGMTLTGRGDARVLRASYVTGNFFPTLGVRAEIGHALEEADTWDTAPLSVVLSHSAWIRDFGGDPSVVGTSIALDGKSYQVVGVMPAGFTFPWDNADMWTGFHWSKNDMSKDTWRRTHWLYAIARLRPGTSVATANAQLQAVAERLRHDHPTTNAGMGAGIVPLHDFLIGDTRRPLTILLAAVGVLLLIACANVGNLLLVRAAGRQREAALRLALGAGHARLVRHAITESLVLSTIGGGLGLALGWFGTRALVTLQPAKLLPVREFGVDPTVAVFVASITIAAGLIFGIAPALWVRHRDPSEALKDGSRGGTWSRGVTRWRDSLVIIEVALAMVMTMSAGLLVRSFWRMANVDPGFDVKNVVILGLSGHKSGDAIAFFDQFLARAKTLPGVVGAARSGVAPLDGQYAVTTDFVIRGRGARQPQGGLEVPHFSVSPEFFPLLRVPLRRGRLLDASDRKDTSPTVLINETFARTYFAGEDPVGQQLCYQKTESPTCVWYSIVGVVGDIHDRAIDQAPRPALFQSTLQSRLTGGPVFVKTVGDPLAVLPSLRNIVRELEPDLPISSVRTLEELRSRSLERTRFFATLLGTFAIVGLVLAIVGVHGVVAQLARARTREMGSRIALGARASQVRALLVSHGLRLTVVGLVAGTSAALILTRAIRTLLFDVTPNDPMTLIGVAVLLTAASLAAALIPAAKASRADPAQVLRSD
jgi:putative ABC transport system permease protein